MIFHITKEEFAKLVKDTCLEHGEFVLKSGEKSNFYLDIRKLTLSTDNYYLAVMLDRQLQNCQFDSIGGPETGANQIVGGYLAYLGDPTPRYTTRISRRGFVVRKEEKDHGKDGLIVGNLKPKDKVVLVDDVVTKGGSILQAVETVEAFGAKVIQVIAVVDRGQGGKEAVEKKGVNFLSLLTLADLGL